MSKLVGTKCMMGKWINKEWYINLLDPDLGKKSVKRCGRTLSTHHIAKQKKSVWKGHGLAESDLLERVKQNTVKISMISKGSGQRRTRR